MTRAKWNITQEQNMLKALLDEAKAGKMPEELIPRQGNLVIILLFNLLFKIGYRTNTPQYNRKRLRPGRETANMIFKALI
ncbi:hypothetical protein NEOLI_000819 [Neolecta irregularis DAH-3]|uniref:Uncharacterized protein n=1 Tax=Neolecta irregularis (strain DAH-3) TaxID=1198029 RepID=A0A1U7LRN4_NEOID|nr:hypothetical protein NEOLI_000819 [Neolecta irregularis DAH-3]|eukprot:OLL25243.1 hypothetical protein NEOLI_000819 [Neolecta irregularis DAH-3]